MRVRILNSARNKVGLFDAMVALHDGLLDGRTTSLSNRKIVIDYPEIDLKFSVIGKGFSPDGRGGTIKRIVVDATDVNERVAVFDRMSLPLAKVDQAIRKVDRANFSDNDPSDEASLWILLTSTGLTYHSAGRVYEGQGDAYGPTFPALNGTKLPWSLAGDDDLSLSGRTETLRLDKGNDVVRGEGGDDQLFGEAGRDKLFGDAGDDFLYGGASRDRLAGGAGGDDLYGGASNDHLSGQAGGDELHGEAGRDKLFGGDGSDQLFGEAGNDVLRGGSGNDFVQGGDGADRLSGDDGDDALYGGGGADSLFGGAGDDTLWDDVDFYADDIYPGASPDYLNGGAGNDTFQLFAGRDRVVTGAGADEVLVFYDPENSKGRMRVIVEDLSRKDEIDIDARHLDDLRTAYRDAQRDEDADWWRAFFQTETAGGGSPTALFSSDGLSIEIAGRAATAGLFFQMLEEFDTL